MSQFTQAIAMVQAKYDRKVELEKEINALANEIIEENEEFCSMLEALEYIGALSEKNANKVLDFITGVINNALAKIFPYDKRSIKLVRSLYRNAYTHIDLKLITGDGEVRDLATQSGTGLRQIISFLFTLTLIEVRKERKIFISDELLSGLHSKAKEVIEDIMQLFVKNGFQFICVEYGMNDIGKIYLVEKPGKIATVREFQGAYTDDIMFHEELEESLEPSIILENSKSQKEEPFGAVIKDGKKTHAGVLLKSIVTSEDTVLKIQ